MYNNEQIPQTTPLDKTKKKRNSSLIPTFFRNALRSNLDLTSLADTKAGILISINGFILTVSVTASSFTTHSKLMTYAFIAIILTSLGSIILAVLAVKPRTKKKLVKKEFLEDYNSLLYYQDMADHSPSEYHQLMNSALKSVKRSKTEMISHLHILGSEIKKKYFWLKYAYAYFSLGLLVSASLIVYALIQETVTQEQSKEKSFISSGQFYNIFEPSGATTLADNKVLIVEDESSSKPFKLIGFDEDRIPYEIEDLDIPKKFKKEFKKKIEDLEALASDQNIIYAITSHSLNRSHEQKSSREKLLMIKYKDGSFEKMHSYKHLKQDLIKFNPELFDNTILGFNPLNIEGLAFDTKENSLVLGLRAPTLNSKALLIKIRNPKELFLNQPKQPYFEEIIPLELNGLGIRALVYDQEKDGYWIIAGDSGQRTSKFSLYFYTKSINKLEKKNHNFNLGNSEGITIIESQGKRFLFCVEDNGEKPNKAANYTMIELGAL